MDFAFSDEQDEFRAVVRRFIEERWSAADARKLAEKGREQCRESVRTRLDTELGPLVPQLADQIWSKLRPALPVQRNPA